MAYDPKFNPNKCRALSGVFASAGMWQKIPGVKEPELKISIDDPSNFAGVFSYLVSQEDITVSPEINPLDYYLLSLSVDTLHRDFNQEELQLRARGDLKETSEETFGQFDVCVKTLLSSVDIRDEVESREGEINCLENYYSQFIEAKRSCPEKLRELKTLPESLHDINDRDLFVEAVCVTSRSNFYLILEIEDGVFARVDATADQNMFLTPHTDMVAGQDNEMEFEVKEIGTQEVLSDDEIHAYSKLAMKKLQDIIQNEFPEATVYEKSKIERASDAVMHTYHKNNHGLSLIRSLKDLGRIAAQQWPVYQRVTVADVLEPNNHLPMFELVSANLKDPSELLDVLQTNNLDEDEAGLSDSIKKRAFG